jgi:hypothetical protein
VRWIDALRARCGEILARPRAKKPSAQFARPA